MSDERAIELRSVDVAAHEWAVPVHVDDAGALRLVADHVELYGGSCSLVQIVMDGDDGELRIVTAYIDAEEDCPLQQEEV